MNLCFISSFHVPVLFLTVFFHSILDASDKQVGIIFRHGHGMMKIDSPIGVKQFPERYPYETILHSNHEPVGHVRGNRKIGRVEHKYLLLLRDTNIKRGAGR